VFYIIILIIQQLIIFLYPAKILDLLAKLFFPLRNCFDNVTMNDISYIKIKIIKIY